jgi:hypothetical protein
MTTFKDFLRDQDGGRLATQLEQAMRNLPAVGATITSADATAIERAVHGVLSDDAFLTELSDRLPQPSDVTSEDEFVSRATDIARELLTERFSGSRPV